MHELSIAISLVEAAAEEAARRDARVRAVHLRLGPLSGVVADALLFSWEIACQDTPLEGTQLVIQHTPIRAWCPRCSTEKTILSPQDLCCPDCAAPTPDLRGGLELELTALEIFDDHHAHGPSPATSAQAQ